MAKNPLHEKLYTAVNNGDIETVKFYLQNGVLIDNQDIIMANYRLNEKFNTAVKNGDIEAVKLYIQNGADIDYQNLGKMSALTLAAFKGHLEIVRLLLDKGCQTNTRAIDGMTALGCAAFNGNIEITKLIIGSGCQLDIRDVDGSTALMKAASQGHVGVVQVLLENGCRKNIRSRKGETALHVAVLHRQLEVTKYLIEKGGISAFVKTSPDQGKKTPYDLAASELLDEPQSKKVMEYLQFAMSKPAQDARRKSSRNIQETLLKDKVPTEIKSMTDKQSVEVYLKMLESGSEKKKDIRLVSVGEKGAGKTSLIKKLFGEDITDITSTNGIEIHTVKCKANSDDGLWTKLEGNSEETEIHGRLLKPYEKSLNDKETVGPLVVGGDLVVRDNMTLTDDGASNISDVRLQQPEMVNPPGINTSEVEALRITAFNVRPAGIMASNENPARITESKVKRPVTTEQSREPSEQAKRDIKTMLTDRSKVDYQDKEDYATLLLWDFAGDEEFYHTYQTFLSPEAIYLVVAKLNDAHDKKAQEMFQLWMNSIHCYCKLEEQKNTPEINNTEREKDKNGSLEPRVVLVGSHKDKVEPSERKKIDEACSERIDSYVNTISEVAQHHIHDEYCISNTVMSVNDDNVFKKIRQAVLVLARNMKTWNTDYPLKFIQLEKLLHVKKKEWPIISMEKIKQISLETPLPLNKEELELFLKYHHEIRALVYFEDLPDYIILDTQWLANAFKCIVTADKFRSGPGRRLGTKTWADLHDKGILNSAILEHIKETNKNTFKFKREHNNHILNVMEKFDIIIRPNLPDKNVTRESPLFYVPCMVKARPTLINIYEMFKVANDEKSAWLCFEFSFLPPHLINHLIASLSRKYEVAETVDSASNTKKIALFKGLAVFECKEEPANLQKIIVLTGLNLIQIQVWEFAKNAKIEEGMYKHIADFVTDEISNIISRRFKMSNVNFEKKWACGLSITKAECVVILNNFIAEPISEYRCRSCNETHTFIDEWSKQQHKPPSEQERYCKDISDILDQMVTRLVISVNDRRTIEQNVSEKAQEQKLLELVIQRGEPNKSACIDVLQQYSCYKDLAKKMEVASSRPPTENIEILVAVPDYKVRLQKNYLKIINTLKHNSQ